MTLQVEGISEVKLKKNPVRCHSMGYHDDHINGTYSGCEPSDIKKTSN